MAYFKTRPTADPINKGHYSRAGFICNNNGKYMTK